MKRFNIQYNIGKVKYKVMKRFNIQYNIGKVKYLVNYHNGIFFEIKSFKNKKLLNNFIQGLLSEGYVLE